MDLSMIKPPSLKEVFQIEIQVEKPIVVGQNDANGRRQLIEITGGVVSGSQFKGHVLPGGVDSQIIRPDGKCELSARYAIQLEDGATIYIQNDGIRTVPKDYVETVKEGGFVDPSLYYFVTVPTFETYDANYKWLEETVFICNATRLANAVLLNFYAVEKAD